KAGVWFRRVRFVIFSPDLRHPYSPLSGSKSTYLTVQISGTSSPEIFSDRYVSTGVTKFVANAAATVPITPRNQAKCRFAAGIAKLNKRLNATIVINLR
ncbi:MAG: hypothetical protein WBD65_03305, partial [Methylocella sp.]